MCGKMSIIQVATSSGVPFYSCITEGCKLEAHLLANIGDDKFVEHFEIYKTLDKIVRNGKTDDNEGES